MVKDLEDFILEVQRFIKFSIIFAYNLL